MLVEVTEFQLYFLSKVRNLRFEEWFITPVVMNGVSLLIICLKPLYCFKVLIHSFPNVYALFA